MNGKSVIYCGMLDNKTHRTMMTFEDFVKGGCYLANRMVEMTLFDDSVFTIVTDDVIINIDIMDFDSEDEAFESAMESFMLHTDANNFDIQVAQIQQKVYEQRLADYDDMLIRQADQEHEIEEWERVARLVEVINDDADQYDDDRASYHN